jgi:hypothetical protein
MLDVADTLNTFQALKKNDAVETDARFLSKLVESLSTQHSANKCAALCSCGT